MSKGIKKPIPVLIVDDDETYVDDDFKLEARLFGLDLVTARNTAEAIDILEGPNGKKIKGFIVDVLGYVDSDQSSADRKQYWKTMKYIESTSPLLPVVTLTGFEGEYELIKERADVERTDIYFKGKDEVRMFEEMYAKLLDLKSVEIIKTYQEVFDVIDEFFDGEAEELLVHCLLKCSSNERPELKGVLNNVRTIYEQFFYELNKFRKDLVPDKYLTSEYDNKFNIKFSNIYGHLKGNYDKKLRTNTTKVLLRHDTYIDRLMVFLYRICSEDSHLLDKEISRKPSKYTVIAATNTLLELIMMFKSIIKEQEGSLIC